MQWVTNTVNHLVNLLSLSFPWQHDQLPVLTPPPMQAPLFRAVWATGKRISPTLEFPVPVGEQPALRTP